jgi:hypothetical protein
MREVRDPPNLPKEWQNVWVVSTHCKPLICIISFVELQRFSFLRFLEVLLAQFFILSFGKFFFDSFHRFGC